MQELNVNEMTKRLKNLGNDLASKLGDLESVLKPMQTKRSVKIPHNGKIITVEVTNQGTIHITIPEVNDSDINSVIEKLK